MITTRNLAASIHVLSVE